MRKTQVAVLFAAIVLVSVNAAMALSATRLTIAIGILDAVICIMVVASLWIVTLPLVYRLIPTLAIVVSFLVLASQTDMYSIDPSRERIDEQVLLPKAVRLPASNNGAPQGDDMSTAGTTGRIAGASVRFDAGKDGGDWARRLNAKLDRQIGGTQASDVSIIGSVSAEGIQAERTVSLTWTVALQGKAEECGRSSVIGPDDQILLEQIARPIETAIQRTAQSKAPTCY